jgi:hypothetical protein
MRQFLKTGNEFYPRRPSLPLPRAAYEAFLADKRFLNIHEALVDMNLFRIAGIFTLCRNM